MFGVALKNETILRKCMVWVSPFALRVRSGWYNVHIALEMSFDSCLFHLSLYNRRRYVHFAPNIKVPILTCHSQLHPIHGQFSAQPMYRPAGMPHPGMRPPMGHMQQLV